MNFLFILLIIILILILSIFVIGMILFNNVKNIVGLSGISKIFGAMRNIDNLQVDEYTRPKDVSGMTSLVEPQILRDFDSFNKDLLYSLVESNLVKIFNAIESKDAKAIRYDPELVMIRNDITTKIDDLNSCNISVRYDGVKFHRHALKRYTSENGMATVEVSSALEYYYDEIGNSKVKLSKKHAGVKKQTRYTTKFAYIYDESKFNEKMVNFSINCPNCGAPLRGIDSSSCEYCRSHVEPINLKSWKMISYKEDYKDLV